MKLYLKRNTTDEEMSFNVYDHNENIIFDVRNSIDSKMKMSLESKSGDPFSQIRLNTLLFTYFTIRCRHHFYVLLPYVREKLYFSIYGSTYKFSGNIFTGSYAACDAEGKIMMTMERTHTISGSEAYELNINDDEHKIFLISCAICAASYQIADVSQQLAGSC